jgi:hypothetical protein
MAWAYSSAGFVVSNLTRDVDVYVAAFFFFVFLLHCVTNAVEMVQ